MVHSKNELFSAEFQKYSGLFKALGHPARLAILKYLADIKTCFTGDIAGKLPLSRTTVNQHLRELKDIGLITGATEGARTCYCLNEEKIKELKEISKKFVQEIDVRINPDCMISNKNSET